MGAPPIGPGRALPAAGPGQRPRLRPRNRTRTRPVFRLVFCCHGAKAPARLSEEFRSFPSRLRERNRRLWRRRRGNRGSTGPESTAGGDFRFDFRPDFRPGVAQSDGTVEHPPARLGIWIGAEIALPLKLEYLIPSRSTRMEKNGFAPFS